MRKRNLSCDKARDNVPRPSTQQMVPSLRNNGIAKGSVGRIWHRPRSKLLPRRSSGEDQVYGDQNFDAHGSSGCLAHERYNSYLDRYPRRKRWIFFPRFMLIFHVEAAALRIFAKSWTRLMSCPFTLRIISPGKNPT